MTIELCWLCTWNQYIKLNNKSGVESDSENKRNTAGEQTNPVQCRPKAKMIGGASDDIILECVDFGGLIWALCT